MGLDYVELLLTVEEVFQIHFEESEIHRVETFDDLNQLVFSKLQRQSSGACLTSVAFYRTRRALVDSLGIERRQVRTWTPLELFLPRRQRRENWRNIQTRLELKLPDLVHPTWMQIASVCAGVALSVMPAIYLGIRGRWLALSCFIGLASGLFLIRLAPWLASEFPNGDVTVGDLGRDVLAANYAKLEAEFGSASRRDVWETLCRVIAAETGVDPKLIKPGAPLVETLQID
jgi:hypothetical protein